MTNNIEITHIPHRRGRGTFLTYTTGYVSSILLTLGAYVVVVNHILNGGTMVFVIVAFGMSQLLVQLLFFLHLGSESGPRWNLVIFLFTIIIVAIMVGGSLWIMANLNYNMIPPAVNDAQQYLINQ